MHVRFCEADVSLIDLISDARPQGHWFAEPGEMPGSYLVGNVSDTFTVCGQARLCQAATCTHAAEQALTDEDTIWHIWWSTQRWQCRYWTVRHNWTESEAMRRHSLPQESHVYTCLTTNSIEDASYELKFVTSIVGAMRSLNYCTFMTWKRREANRLWCMIDSAQFDSTLTAECAT